MADSKTTGLTEDTSFVDADLIATIADVSTTPVNRKMTGANFVTSAPFVSRYTGVDGWTPSQDTWTYASATTFTIAGVDRTATYTKGTLLRCTNTTEKFFIVSTSSFSTNTTVTIVTMTDYVLANAAITAPVYSYQAKPQGWPKWFNYVPTITGWSTPPTTIARFSVVGGQVFINIGQAAGATANATTRQFTTPVGLDMGASEPATGFTWWTAQDNGVTLTATGRVFINSAAPTLMQAGKDMSGAAWTASGTSRVNFAMAYGL